MLMSQKITVDPICLHLCIVEDHKSGPTTAKITAGDSTRIDFIPQGWYRPGGDAEGHHRFCLHLQDWTIASDQFMTISER